MGRLKRWIIGAGCALVLSSPIPATGQVTLSDYQRAEQFMGQSARELVSGVNVRPEWMTDGRFWYRTSISGGDRFRLVDPNTNTHGDAFDHGRLAAALSLAADTAYEADALPFSEISFSGDTLSFVLQDSLLWRCSTSAYSCSGPTITEPENAAERPSPDGTRIAFVRDHNLWVRDAETGEERQLTHDGEEWHSYGTNDQCCSQVTAPRQGRDRPPVLSWSPDSEHLLTLKLDRREVQDLHLLETAQGRPILHTYRYGLPGDSVVPQFDLHVLDVNAGTNTRVDVPKQVAGNTVCCGLMTDTLWKDVSWSPDGSEVFFTVGQRDFKRLTLMAADPMSGTARTVLEETSPTFLETTAVFGRPNWRVLQSGDVIWFSESDGWGHLYLRDGTTGAVKNRITEGEWLVHQIVVVDEPSGWVYFTAAGREEGRDPYFRHLYRANIAGGGVQLLTSEDADHAITVSPDGRRFVDTYSTRQQAPTTVVRDRTGRILDTVEVADISGLEELGWQPPTAFVAKGADGRTDIHGLLYRPIGFDSTANYPVVDYIYPGPQSGPIGSRSFNPTPGGNPQALAELGFIVVTLDASGTPGRSKAFHDSYYGDMGSNGIGDHVAVLKELAVRVPQMDLSRVGIFGHSGGGFSSTAAMLRYPNFFKVAVSTAGNHDNRSYDYTWGEKYQGLVTETDGGGDSFDSQANHQMAANLSGKLLLAYGTLDDNVHPNATLILIDELIKHNKDFDVVVMPNRNHGYANDPYMVRKTWDYFVRHLRGEEPPAGFRIRAEDSPIS